jgi:predicted transcriptional regulator
MKTVIGNFFNGSTSSFASFFAESDTLNLTELEQMKALLEAKIKTLKENDE